MATVLSIGNFDGLHLGHLKLLDRVLRQARLQDLRSLIVSYDDHPAYVLNRQARPLKLLPAQVKRSRLLELGIDAVELLHFDSAMARMSAEQFLQGFLLPKYDPRVIVVGYDSHFGWQRSGTPDFLLSKAQDYGYQVDYVKPYLFQNAPLSSTLIRDLLQAGDLDQANNLLARPYTLFGKVVTGAGLGRDLSFPTANLVLSDLHQLVPRTGVYLSKVCLGADEFFGLTNIGTSPTMKRNAEIEIETYLIGLNQQIYGQELQIALLRYLREEKMFASREDLRRAIQSDLAVARKLIGSM